MDPAKPAPVIITLDGPAGSGKSTMARRLAHRLGLEFLDTGAMYRGITAACLDGGIDPARDPGAAVAFARQAAIRFDWRTDPPRLYLRGRDVTPRLRDPDVTHRVSDVAGLTDIRRLLVAAQREIGREHPRLVTEGRDQGTVVFPDAAVKFYLDADPVVRARRRAEELRRSGERVDAASILEDILRRDARDRTRVEGPLRRPENAIDVNTSDLTMDEVVDLLERETRARWGATPRRPPPARGRVLRPPRASGEPMFEGLRARQPGRPIYRVLWWHVLHFLCYLWIAPSYRYRAWGVHHVPRTGPVLLVSNHQSLLDPILVGLAAHHRQFYAMARSTLFRQPAFGWLIRSLNAVAIERGESDLSAMRKCIEVLKEGHALLIFPEGTRTPDGTTKPFASGTMLLIKRSGATVVPTAIEGAFDAWPKGRKLPRATGRIRVAFGEPVPAARLLAMPAAEALESLRRRVETMRGELSLREAQERPSTAD